MHGAADNGAHGRSAEDATSNATSESADLLVRGGVDVGTPRKLVELGGRRCPRLTFEPRREQAARARGRAPDDGDEIGNELFVHSGSERCLRERQRSTS